MKWDKDSLLTFNPNIQDKLEVVDVFLNIRHTGMYPYSNLFLFLNIDLPNGKTKTDTIECMLANNRGMWLGSGIGDLFDYKKPIIRIAEPDTGTYRLSIQHGMRVNKLEEITAFGISLEKPKKVK